MSDLVGTATLARFTIRRDRVRIAVWIAALVGLVYAGAASTKGIYPTQADLDQAAALSRGSPVALAFNGPDQALDTLGGQVAFQIGASTLVLVGLMTLLLTSRWTRGEEESGRLELVRSMPVGRHAPVAAALAVVLGVNAVVAALVTVSLATLGLPVAGSVAMGLSFLTMGLVFAGVTAVTTQVSENTRVAGGLAGAVLAASFVLRAVGDVGDGTLSWLSPIGWSQKLRPFAGEAWWALAVPLVATVALAAATRFLAARRDFGAGLVAPRPGPVRAAPLLGHPVGLAVRLERGAVFWWSVAVVVMGAAYGSLTNEVEQFVSDNDALQEMIARSGGGSLTESYLGTSMLILALLAAGYAVQSVLRPRAEEQAGRAEAMLATRLGRVRWMAGHVAVTAVGCAVVLGVAGLATGLTAAAVMGDSGLVLRVTGAGLAYLPATWVVVGLGAALMGFAPRATAALWAVLAGAFVIGFLRELLDLPDWVADLSPFEHTPRLPAVDVAVTPLVVMTAIAVGLAAVGFAGFRRRDVSA